MNTFLKAVGVVALCLVGGCVLLTVGGVFVAHKAANDPKIKQVMEDMKQPPIATLAEFNAIQNGMSYEQVRIIIGTDGTVSSENNIAGFHTIMYSWQNGDFSNMNAMFQNGKLIQKAQFGLK